MLRSRAKCSYLRFHGGCLHFSLRRARPNPKSNKANDKSIVNQALSLGLPQLPRALMAPIGDHYRNAQTHSPQLSFIAYSCISFPLQKLKPCYHRVQPYVIFHHPQNLTQVIYYYKVLLLHSLDIVCVTQKSQHMVCLV